MDFDLVLRYALVIGAVLNLLFVLGLCKAAARGDRMAEAAYRQLLREQGRE